jgi:hypothetical protein
VAAAKRVTATGKGQEMTPPKWGKTMGPCPTCEALARTIMLDQTSHDTKPQWQGLTFDDIDDLGVSKDWVYGARWAEAKLREKNT